MTEIKHTLPPWNYFVGNANGRGLIRIEQDGTGKHIASMPRGAESEANAGTLVEAVNSHASLTAERDRLREENDRFRSIMQSIKNYGELACVEVDRGFLRPGGKKPATKDVWQFPRHMLTGVDAALGGSNAD